MVTHAKPHGSDTYVTVPDGVAHFLEHKLFENEEEDKNEGKRQKQF